MYNNLWIWILGGVFHVLTCSNQDFCFNREVVFHKHEETDAPSGCCLKLLKLATEAPKMQSQPPKRWMLHVDLDLRLAAVALLVA